MVGILVIVFQRVRKVEGEERKRESRKQRKRERKRERMNG